MKAKRMRGCLAARLFLWGLGTGEWGVGIREGEAHAEARRAPSCYLKSQTKP